MNRALPVNVTTGDRCVSRIIDEQLVLVDVEKRLPVGGCQIPRSQDNFWGSGCNHASGQKQNMVCDTCLREIVRGHDDCAATFDLIVDDGVDRLGGGQVDPR